jgi:hypothetical protein
MLPGDCGKLLWHRANPAEHLIDVSKKPHTEACLFVVVPAGSLLEVGFRQRPNDEPSGHSI